jgi:hypothetical protein
MSTTPPPMVPTQDRCQAMIGTYNAWIMGGRVWKTDQCKRRPRYVAQEKTPTADDGLLGALSVCSTCKQELMKQRQDVNYIPVSCWFKTWPARST